MNNNKNNSFTCSKCGSNSYFIKAKGNNTGLYCEECGNWQKWLSKTDAKEFSKKQNNESNSIDKTLSTTQEYIKPKDPFYQVFLNKELNSLIASRRSS